MFFRFFCSKCYYFVEVNSLVPLFGTLQKIMHVSFVLSQFIFWPPHPSDESAKVQTRYIQNVHIYIKCLKTAFFGPSHMLSYYLYLPFFNGYNAPPFTQFVNDNLWMGPVREKNNLEGKLGSINVVVTSLKYMCVEKCVTVGVRCSRSWPKVRICYYPPLECQELNLQVFVLVFQNVVLSNSICNQDTKNSWSRLLLQCWMLLSTKNVGNVVFLASVVANPWLM